MLFDRVADGIAYPCGCVLWDVVTMCSTGNGQWVHSFISVFIMDCCTQPHPICDADGTCLCFCFGIDYLPLSRELFYGSNQVMVLPPYYIEVINIDFMTWSDGMIIYRWVSLLMFLEPFSICPCSFPNILFIALHPITTVFIYDSTFFHDMIFVLGSH